MSLIQVQDKLIADLIRAESVTRCYGNQRKARRAAYHRANEALRAMGYDAVQAAVLCNDAADMALLQMHATDE